MKLNETYDHASNVIVTFLLLEAGTLEVKIGSRIIRTGYSHMEYTYINNHSIISCQLVSANNIAIHTIV